MRWSIIGTVAGVVAMLAVPANAQHVELDQYELLAEDTCTYGEGVLESFNYDYDWCVRTIQAEWDVAPGPLYTCYYDGRLCVRRDAPGVN